MDLSEIKRLIDVDGQLEYDECCLLISEIERLQKLSGLKVNCATHGERSYGLCPACQKAEKAALRSTVKRLIEMVGAAYTAGWMAGYRNGPLDDSSETNLDWHCGEDWVEDGLRPELLKIIESV